MSPWLLLATASHSQAQTPPSLSFAKQAHFVQTGSTLTDAGGRLFAYFELNTLGVGFTGHIESAGKIHPLQFTPKRSGDSKGVALEKQYFSAAELEADFPTGSLAKIVLTSSGARSESTLQVPAADAAPLPVILNFDSLQNLESGTFSINWRLPQLRVIGSDGTYPNPFPFGSSTVAMNLYIYRADNIAFSNGALVHTAAGTPGGANVSGLQIAPGETLYGEIRPNESILHYTIRWIRFPIRRAALPTPTITSQPRSTAAAVGGTATFSVTASGPSLAYQWRKDGQPIAGATLATLEIKPVQLSDAGRYSVVVSNNNGQATSEDAALAVHAPPAVVSPPASQTVLAGSSVTLTVAAQGAAPFTYQWLRDGEPIAGATNNSYTLDVARLVDSGSYSVKITNAGGTTTSAAAELIVQTISRISNLSIRAQAGGSAGALAVGVTIGGAGTGGDKPLLVRAAGPTLAVFGLAGTLADPRLSILSGTSSVAQNDDWAGNADVTSASTLVGAFAFSSAASKDAAVAQPIGSGSYTVQINGAGSVNGVVLAEVYDASPVDTFYITTPRLTNVSALTHVGTGSDVLIAGFSVAGTTPKQVLIRGIGPALAAFGAAGTLADPKLELFRAGSATAMATNDNWATAANADEVAAAAVNVGAFALGRTGRDAALLVSLPPGTYSAQISGVNNTTGTALVEVYELP